jgi:hypothetical protein
VRTPRALALALALATGCSLVYEPDVGPRTGGGSCDKKDSDTEVDVSFGADIQPLLNRPAGGRCTSSSCHSASAALSGLSLASYDALRRGGTHSGTNIVIPEDPCASVLVQKLSGAPPFGARMPYEGPPFLSDSELQLVRDWITEGAADN